MDLYVVLKRFGAILWPETASIGPLMLVSFTLLVEHTTRIADILQMFVPFTLRVEQTTQIADILQMLVPFTLREEHTTQIAD